LNSSLGSAGRGRSIFLIVGCNVTVLNPWFFLVFASVNDFNSFWEREVNGGVHGRIIRMGISSFSEGWVSPDRLMRWAPPSFRFGRSMVMFSEVGMSGVDFSLSTLDDFLGDLVTVGFGWTMVGGFGREGWDSWDASFGNLDDRRVANESPNEPDLLGNADLGIDCDGFAGDGRVVVRRLLLLSAYWRDERNRGDPCGTGIEGIAKESFPNFVKLDVFSWDDFLERLDRGLMGDDICDSILSGAIGSMACFARRGAPNNFEYSP
jgi:hypothetical protein